MLTLHPPSDCLAIIPPRHRPPDVGAYVVRCCWQQVRSRSCRISKMLGLVGEEGEIRVDWEVQGKWLILHWQESKGPPVTAPVRRGFGRVVTETMVSQATDGEAIADFSRAGLYGISRSPAPISTYISGLI